MKKYVFITMNITKIGGAQQYLRNKALYLQDRGFEVYIISALFGSIMINELKNYSDTIVPNVMYPLDCFTAKEKIKVIKKIKKIIEYTSEDIVYIECNSVHAAEWGELLGREVKGKSIVFNLQEVHNYSQSEVEFLQYKHSRKELYGITNKSVGMMLRREALEDDACYTFSASCNNVVEDIDNSFLPLLDSEARYTIGSIGRLNKAYVIPLMSMLKNYFKTNSHIRYNLVLIGGTEDKTKIKKIRKLFSDTDNVNLIITGVIYPIPRQLIKSVDLFVSTAGSAYVSYMEKIPTIKIDPINAKMVGIKGSTEFPLKSSMYETYDVLLPEIIDRILRKDINIEFEQDLDYEKYNVLARESFDKQLNLYNLVETIGKDGYDISCLSPPKGRKYRFYKLLGKVMGGNNMQKIMLFIRFVIK